MGPLISEACLCRNVVCLCSADADREVCAVKTEHEVKWLQTQKNSVWIKMTRSTKVLRNEMTEMMIMSRAGPSCCSTRLQWAWALTQWQISPTSISMSVPAPALRHVLDSDNANILLHYHLRTNCHELSIRPIWDLGKIALVSCWDVDMTSVRYGYGESWPDVVHNVAVCDLM